MTHAQAPTAKDFALLALLSLLFSTTYLWTKIAVAQVGPMSLTMFRFFCAGLILAAIMAAMRIPWPRGLRIWKRLAVIEIFAGVLPASLINWSAQKLDSGLLAILAGALPLAALIVMHWGTKDEKISPRKALGVLIGFCGVLMLVGPSALMGLGQDTIAQFAALVAVFSWAFSNLLVRRLTDIHPLAFNAGACLVGAAMLVPPAFIFETPLRVPSTLIIAVVILGGFLTAAMSMIVRYLIVHVGATFPTWNGYLAPPLAVVWGTIFLGEQLRTEAFFALGLILVGMAVTNLRLGQRK